MSRDYEIGRGKPPKTTRFKRGQSGNPGGRPKGSKNLPAVIRQELRRQRAITLDGQSRKVQQLEVIGIAIVAKAMTGSLSHIQALLDMRSTLR